MGSDIYGFVECRATHGIPGSDDEEWSTAVDLYLLYSGRSYDAFGCLFGVRNYSGFEPLAADRGLPEDVAEPTRAEHAAAGSDVRSTTWISWTELAGVDWDHPAEQVDERVHRYRLTPDGAWRFDGKVAWGRDFARVCGRPAYPEGGGRPWAEGTEWRDGDVLYRVERLRRRDAVPEASWGPVWTTMRTLADLHGGDNVRLVVWFD